MSVRIALRAVRIAIAAGVGIATLASSPDHARAENKLLAETVDFTGTILFLSANVPALVIGVIRDGETVVRGYGEIAKGSGKEPDGDTLMRIGSITKVMTGATLASLVADGTVDFGDPLQDRLGWDVKIPERDGKKIRLIDLATHSSGLPREAEVEPAGEGQPTATGDKESYIATLKTDPQLFAPGTGILYSNFGFDLLAQALANAAGKPYAELLKERVLDSAGLKDTRFDLTEADRARTMQGHNFDGAPLPFMETAPIIQGAGGLYSTANDMLRWLRWHLGADAKDFEMRLLDHATFLQRDGLDPVFGMDEGSEMDAMGLGWVIQNPEGARPLIMQKTGGLQGQFSYIAFAPSRGIGVFVSINQFSVSGFDAMVKAANGLIAELAPR
ncbi:MAG: D-alanyl-D-alanine-carboxypeptidase/endopeptidase AmpH [Methyloceanibacter sp.]|uniref:D-alanyl-D-alanine- carboxypeptidase/endopeptidase AmpH n=1 Tax=Methyloceanibacter sp. TaxID=1965321 RepID=UPI003D9B12F4